MAELIDEIKIENDLVKEQRSLVHRREQEVRAHIRGAKDYLGYYRGQQKRLKEFDSIGIKEAMDLLSKENTDTATLILDNIHTRRSTVIRDASSYKREYTSNKRKIESYRKSLEQARNKLEVIEQRNEPIILNIEAIREELKDYQHVDENKTFLYLSGSSKRPTMQVRFTKIKCTPDKNEYINLIDNSFILNSVNAIFYLDNNSLYFKRANTTAPEPTGYTQGRRVHPHILGNDNPCMGGFLDAYAAAREEFDIHGMVGVAQLFLESANPDDDAGRHWPKWMLYHAEGSKGNLNLLNSCHRMTLSGHRIFARMTQAGEFVIPVIEDGALQLHTLKEEEAIGLLNHLAEKKQ